MDSDTRGWALGLDVVCTTCAPTVDDAYRAFGGGESAEVRKVPLGRVARGQLGSSVCIGCGTRLADA